MKIQAISGLVCLLLLVAVCTCGCTGSPKTGQIPASQAGPGIRVITENFPPFNTLDRNGGVAGQSTEIVQEILRRQNQNVSIELLPWAEGYRILQTSPNVALYSTGRTAERENLFLWAGPIGSVDYLLYAQNGSAITVPSLEAARKSGTIGVVKDDLRHQFLVSENFTRLYLCSDDLECATRLSEGKIDLWLGSGSADELARLAGIGPGAFRPVYLIKKTELYVAFSRGTPAGEVAAWQAALDGMKQDGTYDRILARHRTGTNPAGTGSPQTVSFAGTGAMVTAVVPILEGRLNTLLRPLEVLALTEEVRSGDWNRIRPLLAGLEAKEPSVRLWYARTDGSYYTTVDGLNSVKLLDRPYFPALLAGNESVGTLVSSHSTGRNVVIVAVPVMENGRVTGALGASVSLDSLTAEIKESLALPESLKFFAVNPAGTVALHSDDERIFQNELSAGPGQPGSAGAAVKGMLLADAGRISYASDGKHWQGQFRTSPLTGWRVAVVSADP